MDINTRRNEIINFLVEKEYITVEDLSRILGVSAVTIRTDLSALEEEGLLIRTHGGAMRSERKSTQRQISKTMSEYEVEKKAIARRASVLIKSASTIIIDSGSTAIHLLPYLKDKGITVVTNNMLAIENIRNEDDINLVVLGGNLRRASMGTIGPLANSAIASMNVDILFLGAAAFDSDIISSSDLIEVELKKNMIKAADKVVFLADSSKYCKKAFATICTWSDIDTFVTDKIDPEFRQALEDMGVEVLSADD